MMRGAFANIRLVNRLVEKPGPQTRHLPSGEVVDIFEAAMRYQEAGTPTMVVAGKEYGSGSSRDWAAKGPHLLGVRAVLALSFERIHRSNLLGMGVLPLQFAHQQDYKDLTGEESLTVELSEEGLTVAGEATVSTSTGKSFKVQIRLDTEPEVAYFKNGGIM